MIKEAFRAAFPHTVPVFAGLWFLGLAYGLYMNASGFSFVYPLLMAMFIYGGSLEFVAVTMLLSSFAPAQAFLMALVIQARHLFYGLSMLDRFRGMGWKKFCLIFGMCDETFSINYSARIPEGVDRGWFMFAVTFLNYIYWVSGAALGGILGGLIHFDTDGLNFVMTAMFIVIFMDQWMKDRKHWTALIGLVCTILCRVVFTAESFMIPSMICILLCLTFLRKPIEREGGLS